MTEVEVHDNSRNAPAKAAVILVGNELLTGKIRDSNGHHLACMLRRVGIDLIEICTVPDDEHLIAETLRRLATRASILFTSGGVGPTHDDVTLASVARAANVAIVRHAEMESILRERYGDALTDATLRMAELPQGTELCSPAGWPILRLNWQPAGQQDEVRVYMLPGVPRLLEAKIAALEAMPDELPHGPRVHLVELFTTTEESRLARELDDVVDAFPDVDIGSYPVWYAPSDGGSSEKTLQSYVRLTFESPARTQAEGAMLALKQRLAPSTLLSEAPTS